MPAYDLRSQVQHLGQIVSRHVFTEQVLRHPLGKYAYLSLYYVFKFLFEYKELKKLTKYIQSGSTVLDIGANVGVTAVYFRHALGSQGSVVAFEPDPVMADIFRFHIKQRNLTGIHLFPIALGERDGMEHLFQNLSNRADNRIVLDVEGMGPTKEVAIHLRALSSIVKECPSLFARVSFVKIDVQGYEYRVLSGMSDWLTGLTDKPVIHMELWPYGLKQAGSSPQALLDLCRTLGYLVASDVPSRLAEIGQSQQYMDITLLPKG